MKTLILSLALAATLMAEASIHDTCQQTNDMAIAVIKARNRGASMAEAMRVADGNIVIERMVEDAYMRPIYSTKLYIDAQVRDFANDWSRTCYQVMRGAK